MQNGVSNIRYNQLLYDSRPVRFDEFISNKYDKIHQQLYTDALTKYIASLNIDNIKTIQDFKKKYNVVEFKGDEYWQPSTIMYITKSYPFRKTTVDLSPYWNKYQKEKNVPIEEVKYFDETQHIDMFELIDIDYIKGKVKLRNKVKDFEFWTTFDKIDSNITVGEEYTLSKLFSSKIKW